MTLHWIQVSFWNIDIQHCWSCDQTWHIDGGSFSHGNSAIFPVLATTAGKNHWFAIKDLLLSLRLNVTHRWMQFFSWRLSNSLSSCEYCWEEPLVCYHESIRFHNNWCLSWTCTREQTILTNWSSSLKDISHVINILGSRRPIADPHS